MKLLRILSSISISCALLVAAEAPPKLPAPYATPSVNNGPKIIPRPEGAQVKVPAGFKVEQFAEGFQRPRFMVEGPGGEVLVSDTAPSGSVTALKAGTKKVLIPGLDRPYGLAFWKDYLYVGEPASIKRYKYDSKALTVGPAEEVVSYAGYVKGHVTRTITFDAKGSKMYVAVGSSANLVTGDPENRAVVNRYNPDGSGHEVFASGVRNAVGLRFFPGTNDLWATVEERDGLGDGLVPDYFTKLKPGGFYGWPYAYLGPNPEPRVEEKDRRPEMVAKTITPDVLLEPHIAVLDFIFYTGKQFPAEYRNGAFLANHGSANRAQRIGYSISFVPFKDGKPTGPVRDFATGWMLGPDQKEVWGRPVGLVELRDGSMLLSDDGGKVIWRISYAR
jgi:glucose/arabinose dehydrogenase